MISIDLRVGSYSFIWNYHTSSQSNVVSVRRISIEGTATGNAYVQNCPAGTFSSGFGSQTCSDCPSGTFSNSPKSSECTLCDSNQFQPHNGSVGCLNCGEGSFSQEGSSHCSTSCIFEVPDVATGKSYTYDLTQLP